jgi:hypothetical protein
VLAASDRVARVEPEPPKEACINTIEHPSERQSFKIPWILGFCILAAVALFFLWEEHEAHLLGALPYALLLLCPIIHLFMHRGHGGHRPRGDGHDPQSRQRPGGGLT